MIRLAVILAYFLTISPFNLITEVAAVSKDKSNNNNLVINQQDKLKLHQDAPSLKTKVLNLAVKAYNHANEKGQVKKPYLTVIDYSLPSSKQRMWVFDVDKDKLLYNTYVAHGKNSGNLYAKSFSNRPSSKASSLGTYITKGTYIGGKGVSLNLQGMEKGYNNNAFDRRVVMHGAWYVTKQFIKNNGRAGRSWGCPAVGTKWAKPIINTIKNGSVIFAYFPDTNWLSHSNYLS